MSSYSIKKRIYDSPNIWPGFVDILATLLIVIIFILMVFTVSQFYLSDAVVGRDKALAELRLKITELSKILTSTEENLETEVQKNIILTDELQESGTLLEKRNLAIFELSGQIGKLRDELQIVAMALEKYEGITINEIDTANLGERINMALASRVDQLKNVNLELKNLNNQLTNLNSELLQLNKELDIKDQDLKTRLQEIENKNIQLSNLNESLVEKDNTIFSLREKILKLNDILALSDEESEKQKAEIQLLNQEAEESQLLITEKETSVVSALEQVASLSEQIGKINDEIEILNAALEASERDRLTKELRIEVLGEKLNKALTSQVLELQQYRSEFFGRLKEILGSREDIRVVGDRFIFESELLFDSGSANLQEEGKNNMIKIAETLKSITDQIPNDIDWIVQVEGHTDNIPISTYLYPSNWELSTARANSVLKLLIQVGFDPAQLAAAGYGEFHPISSGSSIDDLKQNRRIELKLTSR
ncbi:MAG: Motility protein B [Alphaproteobacteria bacterium MarineAlpha5_Bin12]|nr:hypothetical protein [Pelagibacteraceae bacterium]PPR41386.1 MAG: Motility protein B [Alphaproteobacteria bacterium MarineAlpha5_Bin12]|tara:strand:+ start:9706 stop:11145 length:1440 start_codon:yes stop_codon:yes gene_type:complete